MATLSKEKVQEIIKNAPPGTTPASIVNELIARGHTLEGFNVSSGMDSPKNAGVLSRRVAEKNKVTKAIDEYISPIVRPFTRVAASSIGAGVATGAVIGTGIRELAGDKQAMETVLPIVESELTKPRDLGILGQDVTPYGFKKTGEAKNTAEFAGELAGLGLEAGSAVLGGTIAKEGVEQVAKQGAKEVVKKLSEQTVRQAFRNSLKAGAEGAKIGAIGGAGAGLQEDEDQLVNALTGAGFGAVAGATLAGLGSAFVPAITKSLSLAKGGLTRAGSVASGAKDIASGALEVTQSSLRNLKRGSRQATEDRGARQSLEKLFVSKAKNPEQAKVAVTNLSDAGVDGSLLNTIASYTQDELRLGLKMAEVAQRKADDKSLRDLPRQVLVEPFLERINAIKSVSDQAAKKLKALRLKFSDEPIDKDLENDLWDGFIDMLDERGLDHDIETDRIIGKGVDGRKQEVADTELSFYNKVYDLLKNGGYSSNDLDAIRKKLFKEYDLGKARGDYSDSVSRDAEALRSKMLSILDRVAPGFAQASTESAKTIKTLQNAMKAIGIKEKTVEQLKKSDLRSANVIRRLQTNAGQNPDEMLTSMDTLIDELKLEYPEIAEASDVDLNRLTWLERLIELAYDTTPPGTLQSQVRQGNTLGMQDIAGAAVNLATMNPKQALDTIIKPLMGNPSKEAANALKSLIESLIE